MKELVEGSGQVRRTVPAVLERELRLVRGAIAMVASGHAPRVTVAGLRFAEALLEPARRLATAEGVRLTPLGRMGEAGIDLTIDPGDR